MRRAATLLAVTLRNTQHKTPLNLPQIQRTTESLLKHLRLQDYSLHIWFTTNPTIRARNLAYRSQDKPTDVLSFPFQRLQPPPKETKPNDRPLPPPIHDIRDLGEIMISVPYVLKQIPELNTSLEERLKVLIVHGVCHLLGYDHEESTAAETMQLEETRLLELLKADRTKQT